MSNIDFSRRAAIYYVGSFDDEILRHNDAGFNLDSINETLSQAALFGGKLLINDGSLMLSEAGRRALTSSKTSPLLDLMNADFVKLFSRNGGNLASLPLEMEHQVPTYADLIRHSEWPKLRDHLLAMKDSRDWNAVIEPWPNVNTGVGFQRLVNTALKKLQGMPLSEGMTAEQIDFIQKDFNGRMQADPQQPGRTLWRKACEHPGLDLSVEAKSDLHWIGLEAYHYNLAMISSQNRPDWHTGVLTRYSYLFEDIRDPRMPRLKQGASLREIPRPRLPRSISPQTLHRGDLLRSVVTTSTDLYEAKFKWLRSVDDAITDRQALDEAKRAADEYSKEICSFLKVPMGPNPDLMLTGVKLVASTAAKVCMSHLEPTVQFWGQLGVNAVAEGLSGISAWVAKQFITKSGRKTTPLVVDVLDPLDDYSEDVHAVDAIAQGSQWFSLMPLAEQAVAEHVRSLPPFQSKPAEIPAALT